MSLSATWLFTLNNPTETPDELLKVIADVEDVRYVIFQEEKGAEGTRHYQGYVEFRTRKRLAGVRKVIGRAHWEPRRGSQKQAVDYCSKEETRQSGPYEHGEKAESQQGKRTDLSSAVDVLRSGGIKRVREEHPEVFVKFSRGLRELDLGTIVQTADAPEVILLFGPPGCGKTRHFHDTEGPGACHLICSGGYWFDGFDGDEAVLLDDFDGRASRWTLAQTLNTLDRYQIRVPVKGSFVRWCPRRIYVSTNIHPREWFEWNGREQQFPALVRRFTRLIWWRHVGRDGLVVTPGNDEWAHFWKGRQGVQDEVDMQESVRTGHIMSRASNADYFDF